MPAGGPGRAAPWHPVVWELAGWQGVGGTTGEPLGALGTLGVPREYPRGTPGNKKIKCTKKRRVSFAKKVVEVIFCRRASLRKGVGTATVVLVPLGATLRTWEATFRT